MPTQNIGTLVGAAIRPLNDTMPIASAFAFEINGGHHQVATLAERDAIMVQRRQWGMLCTVYNDSSASNNATYQLKYGHFSAVSSDNQNWVVFSGAAGSGSSAGWLDPVLSVRTSAPSSPSNKDRYLVGKDSSAVLSGAFSSLLNSSYSGTLPGGFVAEYSSSISSWTTTLPFDGMTLRVNDEDNSFYRYEGSYPSGKWTKERLNQVRYLSASSSDRVSYSISAEDYFAYSTETVYMVQFATSNSGTSATLNINGLGSKPIKVQSSTGLSDLSALDINTDSVYTMVYDGTRFRIYLSGGGSSGGFDLKYRIVQNEKISVPSYSEYLLHGDLEVNGTLDISSTGKVVIVNGALNVNGGTVSNYGNVSFVKFPMMSDGTANYVPKWASSSTISATSSIYDDGERVSVGSLLRISPGTAPSSPMAGDIYFDSSSSKLRCYDGSSWNDLW